MSVKVMSWVFEHSEATLADRLVLLAIADHANDHGLNAWPSIRNLARKAKVSESTARRAVHRLVEIGELEIVRAGGGDHSNRYRVVMDPCQIDRGGAQNQAETPVILTGEGSQIDGAPLSPADRGAPVTAMTGEPSFNVIEPSFAGARERAELMRSTAKCLKDIVPTAIYGNRMLK